MKVKDLQIKGHWGHEDAYKHPMRSFYPKICINLTCFQASQWTRESSIVIAMYQNQEKMRCPSLPNI